MKTSVALKTLLGAASLALPLTTLAESNFQTGGGTLTATAHVNFTVVIPRVLYLRVGSGSAYNTGALTSVATIETMLFTVPGAQVGNGTPVAATGGNAAASTETAALIGNGGSITLQATNGGALSDGAGDTIPYTQISTAAAAGVFGAGNILTPPTLANGASNTVTVNPPAGSKIVQQDALWTYSYLNTVTPAAGTYGTTGANNGVVTYTAVML